MLPKINLNTQNPPARTCILGPEGSSDKITQFVDHIISPLVLLLFDKYSSGIMCVFLCTLDVTSL